MKQASLNGKQVLNLKLSGRESNFIYYTVIVANLFNQTNITKEEIKPKTIPVPENKKRDSKKWQYGLQLSVPLVKAYNVLDANSKNNISTAFIPTVWVSKSLGSKNALLLFLNPYSNYYASGKAVANTTKYNVVTQQTSQLLPDQAVYTQTISFNKLIGIEAGLIYQYHIKPRITIGAGLSSFFTQSVLLQNKVIKNNKTTIADNIYSVGKTGNEWKYIQQNFLLAQIELAYSFSRFNTGLKLSKPVTGIFNDIEVDKTPINVNLFLRWKF